MLLVDVPSRTNDDRRTLTHYKLARGRSEFNAAFRLVYEGYLHRGLMLPNVHRKRITPYQLSPTSQVFVALNNASVVSTLTLVEDGPDGVPMESLFDQEIRSFRRQRLRIAEVTSLAHGLPNERLDWRIAERLMSLMAQFAVTRSVDRLVIVVCPQHSAFYKRIAFRPFGEVRSYSDVCGKPALPMQVDLNRLEYDFPQVYERFFSSWFPAHALAPRRMPPALVQDFHGIMSEIDIEEGFGVETRTAYQMAG